MPTLKRVNYFNGQLLSAADFQVEQEYLREKQRLHIRALHGFGVVEGLEVSAGNDENGASVSVAPGSALDPRGELLDLCGGGKLRLRSSAAAAILYLRYAERPSDLAPVSSTGPCDSSQPTRIEESCELVLVEESPRTAPRTTKAKEAIKASRALVGNSPGVALARLVRTRTVWRVDRTFKVARAR